jgi:S1-C subfamily serine protease
MKSGRSFSEGALALAGSIALAGALAATGPSPLPAGSPAPGPEEAAPHTVECPRCGYRGDPGWRYCVRCGWDLKTLVGPAAQARLQAIARSTVGVIVEEHGKSGYATAIPIGGPGVFVTIARVLERRDATAARVRTFQNREVAAEILGYDIASGIGVFKADVPDVRSIEIGAAPPSSSGPAWVVCYPIQREEDLVRFLPVSVHRGRVTATGQAGSYLVSFEDLLRTDHTIPRGCLGGPLIDATGAVTGMIVGSPDAGIAYALPLAAAGPTVALLSQGKRPDRPYFGFGLASADDRRRARFGLAAASARPLVTYLIPDSPAARAGILPGDLLVAVGSVAVSSIPEAGARLLRSAVDGPPVDLTLLRGAKEVVVAVPPAHRPSRIFLDPSDELQESLELNLTEVATGPTSQQGLRVDDVVRGGRGEKDGYRNRDVIVAVDGKPVRRLDTFNQAVRALRKTVFAEHPAFDETLTKTLEKHNGAAVVGSLEADDTYYLRLQIRKDGGESEVRRYHNRFPDDLAPPVY